MKPLGTIVQNRLIRICLRINVCSSYWLVTTIHEIQINRTGAAFVSLGSMGSSLQPSATIARSKTAEPLARPSCRGTDGQRMGFGGNPWPQPRLLRACLEEALPNLVLFDGGLSNKRADEVGVSVGSGMGNFMNHAAKELGIHAVGCDQSPTKRLQEACKEGLFQALGQLGDLLTQLRRQGFILDGARWFNHVQIRWATNCGRIPDSR